jgi:hypothetical protein
VIVVAIVILVLIGARLSVLYLLRAKADGKPVYRSMERYGVNKTDKKEPK